MKQILLSIALLVGLSGLAFGQTTPASEIAPGGKLRVGTIAITVIGGVAEPVARFIGQKLGAAVEPVIYPNPEAYLQSFGKGEWDIVIAARVLVPADKADSIADLWVISLVYVAAPGKEFPDIASVDKAGVKIGVIRGAPSDRVLTREIKAAEIVRIPLSPTIAADAADLLRSHKADERPLCRSAGRARDNSRRSKAERRGAEGNRHEGPQGRECRDEVERRNEANEPIEPFDEMLPRG
jgi:ABC-type amino acid transport substrate-binding protein